MGWTITLPSLFAMVPVARLGVTGLLAGKMRVDVVALITSELFTAAVRASAGDVVIRVQDGDEIRVEVHDQRGRYPRTDASAYQADVNAPDGLGLVSSLATAFGSVRHRSGDCTTWAAIAL
ncbi:hypothetical protein ACFO4E_24555 [Nocardiopsis mangrovi]|uniref:Histidine kinase/HSP90-like ATPase domain-containing protein n=1 Tax=Nocardiopsis mangrovi TaxID=1179818 RepID=A0ABV9E1K6_9ACTN